MTQFQNELPVERLHESPLNPRRTFDKKAMGELVASVKEQGRVLHPILVRPLSAAGLAKFASDFEIVCGHRRVRAAREAGLKTVPAVIREMTDREVVETSLLELSTGAPVHPLEQSESMGLLVEQHGQTTEELAAKLSKSKRWVETQLSLRRLSPEAKKAFAAGDLSLSVAIRLARVPAAGGLQKEALGRLLPDPYSKELKSDRFAADVLEREFMLHLKDAPFSIKDAELCPEAGACKACPKRTGAQPELFADVPADICTDVKCYRSKVDAHNDKALADAAARGQAVLTKEEASKAFPMPNASPSGFVELDDVCAEDPKSRTFRKLLGKLADTTLAVNPHTGRIHELVPLAVVKRMLREAGHDWKAAPAPTASERKTPEDSEAKTAGEKLLAAVRVELVKRVVQQKPGVEFLRVLGGFMAENGFSPSEPIATARGFDDSAGWAEKASEDDLKAVIFDTAIDSLAYVTHDGGLSEGMQALAKTWGINLADFEARLKADSLFAKPKASEIATSPMAERAKAALEREDGTLPSPALSVKCPDCKAEPGADCKNTSGSRRIVPHQTRNAAAKAVAA